MTHKCLNCEKVKDEDQYWKNSFSKIGRRYVCIECYNNGYKAPTYVKKPKEEWVDVSTPNSRAKREALKLNHRYYIPPIPCEKHPDSQFVTNCGMCYECKLINQRTAYAKRMEKKRIREHRPKISEKPLEAPKTFNAWQTF